MPPRRDWTRNELLVTFAMYCRTPFGRLHRGNPEIVQIARQIGRTPSAVALKSTNFASLDPVIVASGRKGMRRVSSADRSLWSEFLEDPTEIGQQAVGAYESIMGSDASLTSEMLEEVMPRLPIGPTEVEKLLRTRRVQTFFRTSVLISYGNRCAISGITAPELLTASHIIPWAADESRRADPRNGICLNALYDRAFDRGLIAFDDDFQVMVSRRLHLRNAAPFHETALLQIEGRKLELPTRFAPDREAIRHHREMIFRAQ